MVFGVHKVAIKGPRVEEVPKKPYFSTISDDLNDSLVEPLKLETITQLNSVRALLDKITKSAKDALSDVDTDR